MILVVTLKENEEVEIVKIEPKICGAIKIKESDIVLDEGSTTSGKVSYRDIGFDAEGYKKVFKYDGKWKMHEESSDDPFDIELIE